MLFWGGILLTAIYFIRILVNAKNIGIFESIFYSKKISEQHISSKNTGLFLADSIYMLFQIIWVMIVFLLALWLGVKTAINAGENAAIGHINKYIKNGCQIDSKTKWSNCVKLKNSNGLTLQEGLFVAKNPNEIALFRKEGSYVFRLNDDNVIVKLRNE